MVIWIKIHFFTYANGNKYKYVCMYINILGIEDIYLILVLVVYNEGHYGTLVRRRRRGSRRRRRRSKDGSVLDKGRTQARGVNTQAASIPVVIFWISIAVLCLHTSKTFGHNKSYVFWTWFVCLTEIYSHLLRPYTELCLKHYHLLFVPFITSFYVSVDICVYAFHTVQVYFYFYLSLMF